MKLKLLLLTMAGLLFSNQITSMLTPMDPIMDLLVTQETYPVAAPQKALSLSGFAWSMVPDTLQKQILYMCTTSGLTIGNIALVLSPLKTNTKVSIVKTEAVLLLAYMAYRWLTDTSEIHTRIDTLQTTLTEELRRVETTLEQKITDVAEAAHAADEQLRTDLQTQLTDAQETFKAAIEQVKQDLGPQIDRAISDRLQNLEQLYADLCHKYEKLNAQLAPLKDFMQDTNETLTSHTTAMASHREATDAQHNEVVKLLHQLISQKTTLTLTNQ